MKNTYQNQINKIMREFNFENVHTMMVAMDWKWHNAAEGIYGSKYDDVPTVKQLRETAKHLLESLATAKSEWQVVGSGGFMVRRDKDLIQLDFQFESTSGKVGYGI